MFLKQRKLIGLDININQVRWIQILHTPHQVAVLKEYGTITLNKLHGSLSDILMSSPLKDLLSTSAIGIALQDSYIQKTTLTVDTSLSSIQLKKIFKEKATSLCKQPIKNVYYQCEILGFSKQYPNQCNFLLVAVQKSILEESLKVLKICGLMPKLIDVKSFAQQRGQEILQNRHIKLEKNLDNNDFFNQSENFMVSVGLAMHPNLKNLW